MSGKVLESLGNYEYLMAALTLLGVLYLCFKQANLHLDVSSAAASGAAAGAANKQGFSVDLNTMRFYGGVRTHPGARNGFAGSASNGPELWTTETEMDQVAAVNAEREGLRNEYSFNRRAGMKNRLASALLSN